MKVAIGFLITMFAMGCASSYLKKTDSTNQNVKLIGLAAVQFYRPDFAPADSDDFSHHARNLTCQEPQALFADLLEKTTADSIIGCLNSLTEKDSVRYRFQAKTNPYLDMDPLDSDNPECLVAILPQINLPREIYFLGKLDENSPLRCYASSFSTKSNQFLDAEIRITRFKVQINFPLARKLKDARDLKIWLITSIFSVLNEGKDEFSIPASAVPDDVCNSCFVRDQHFFDKKNGKIDAVLWPKTLF